MSESRDRTIRWTGEIPFERKHVWQVLASPETLAVWLGASRFEAEEGGRVLFDILYNKYRYIAFGNVARIEDQSLIEFSYRELEVHTDTLWKQPTTVTLSFEDRGESTGITLKHEGLGELGFDDEYTSLLCQGYTDAWKMMADFDRLEEICSMKDGD
jgi:uncharacterized protein YndB with AHSA1/START domain